LLLFQSITLDFIVGFVVVILVAFPFHEFAHALAAYRLGDSTARLFGRLTLDPRAHLDPLGTLLLLLAGFGWAKPTPVSPFNLRGGRSGEAIVAAAGPISNLALATAGALPLRFILASGMDVPSIVVNVLNIFVTFNLLLMVFNLLPIPPLDGSKVLFAFLDPQTEYRYRPVLEQYGPMLLLLLVFLSAFGGANILGVVISSVLDPVYELLVGRTRGAL
jgi:Zn-dependent protease